jgi:hypothetical protein
MGYDPKEGFSHGNEGEWPVTDTVVIETGDPVVLVNSTGKASLASAAAGRRFVGWSIINVTGNSAGTVKVRTQTGRCEKTNVLIVGTGAGGTLTAADRGKDVYVTGANAYTVVPAADQVRVGVLHKILSAGTSSDGRGNILWEGIAEKSAGGSTGAPDIMELGILDFASSADGNLIAAFLAPYKARIVSLHGQVIAPCVGSGGTILVNLELAGTNVTGGVLTWSTAAAGVAGTILNATAITAANVTEAGGNIDVEGASAGGTRTSGLLRLYAVVERLAA